MPDAGCVPMDCPWKILQITAKCVMVADACSVGGALKRVDGVFLDDLSIFGINADEWTTPAQEEGE